MKQRKKGYGAMLVLTILLTLAALSTVIPQASAKPSMLGYAAHCPYTPVSTIICLALAAMVCVIRKKKFIETTD